MSSQVKDPFGGVLGESKATHPLRLKLIRSKPKGYSEVNQYLG